MFGFICSKLGMLVTRENCIKTFCNKLVRLNYYNIVYVPFLLLINIFVKKSRIYFALAFIFS